MQKLTKKSLFQIVVRHRSETLFVNLHALTTNVITNCETTDEFEYKYGYNKTTNIWHKIEIHS